MNFGTDYETVLETINQQSVVLATSASAKGGSVHFSMSFTHQSTSGNLTPQYEITRSYPNGRFRTLDFAADKLDQAVDWFNSFSTEL